MIKNALPTLALLLAGAPLAACSSAPEASGPTGTTYYADVKPLMDAKCSKCHTEGGIAPFSLESYDAVKEQAAGIRIAVAGRIMPPWLAGQGCADYEHDRSLTEDEIGLITKWIDDGAEAGDPATEKAAPQEEKGMSRIDLDVGMNEPYTAQIEPDDYRCFLLDWPETEDTFVTGFQANPGNAATVHHVIAFYIPPGSVKTYQALDDADPKPGYTCFGGPGNTIDPNTMLIGTWAPGARGGDLPPGIGLKMEPGSKIALQVHYNTTNGGPQPDQTSISLKLDKKVEKEAHWQFFTNVDWVFGKGMNIPAMSTDTTYSYEVDPTPYVSGGKPVVIYDAGLHMHTRGKHATLSLEHKGGGEECMVDIPKWNFHWQLTYEFSEPKLVSPGDKMKIECNWFNNTPHDIHWGEGTADEMCLGLVLYSAP